MSQNAWNGRSEGNDSVHCLLCDARIVDDGDGSFVCEACGTGAIKRGIASSSCREVEIERSGVRLTKVLVTDEADPHVGYRIRSTRTTPVLFRILDRLPAQGEPSRRVPSDDPGRSAATVDVTWWTSADRPVELRRYLPAGSVETRGHRSDPSIEYVPWLEVEDEDRLWGSTPFEGTEEWTVPDFSGGPGLVAGQSNEPDRDAVLAAVPAYNEEVAIGDVVRNARRFADAVLVVDDGSTDDSVARSREAGAFVRRHRINRGYGATLKTIFREANRIDVDTLVVLDGDGQHDPEDIPNLVEALRTTGANVVIGNRFGRGSETETPWHRWAGIAVINVITNLRLGRILPGSGLGDSQSGFRAYDGDVVASLAVDDRIGDGMGASTDILEHAHRNGYEIAEVETTIDYDVENTNSLNPVLHGFQVLGNVLGTLVRDRPLLALASPGFLLALVGFGGIYVLVEQYLGGSVFVLTLAVAASVVALSGLLAVLAGVLVYSVVDLDRSVVAPPTLESVGDERT